MKLDAKTKKILKIAAVSALAILEIYLIYAAVASMTTYHHHPKFVSVEGGQVAQSSGYRSQFFVCLAFAILIPIGAGVMSYFFWFRKPKAVKAAQESSRVITFDSSAAELAATSDAAPEKPETMRFIETDEDPSPLHDNG